MPLAPASKPIPFGRSGAAPLPDDVLPGRVFSASLAFAAAVAGGVTCFS
jgi:hypothetical protein